MGKTCAYKMLCFLRHPNDHISVMSASQIPKNVRHVPRKFNIFRMYNKNSAIVSCQTHKFQKKNVVMYNGNSTFSCQSSLCSVPDQTC